ncbi:hypothetical protein BDBG_17903, partial [Blastomyces gilchristii SLH14081]
LFSESSLNDHTGSYITVLIGGRGGVTTAVRGAGKGLNMDKLTGRRDDTSLQGMATAATAAREAGEEGEEDVTMKAVLLQFIDAAVSIFNQAFLTVMKTTAVS